MSQRWIKFILAMIGVFLSPLTLLADSTSYYDPSDGIPLQWEPDSTGQVVIHYTVDKGGLGRLTHEQSLLLLQAAMSVWEDSANVSFVLDGTTDAEITADNYTDYLVVDENICNDNSTSTSSNVENPLQFARTSIIAFDNTEDSAIMNDADGISGTGTAIGRTDITCISGTNAAPQFITSAQIILNGSYLDGVAGPADYTVNEIAGIIVHELGHFLGIDHTSTNQVLNLDIDSQTLEEDEYALFVPTMESTLVIHEDQATLNSGDIAAIQALYPFDDSPTSIISGTVTDSSGTDFRGAQLELRNIDDPLCEVFSFISGKQCTTLYIDGGAFVTFSAGSQCGTSTDPSPNSGDFIFRAIPPGTYVLSAQEVIDDYKGGILHPFAEDNPIPEIVGDAEFYNDSDTASESTTARTTITVTAGQDLTGLTIVLSNTVADGDSTENTIPIDFFSTANGFADSLLVSDSRCAPNTVDYAALIGTTDPVANPTTTTANASSAGGCSLMME